jgi:hypothetical protein
MTEAEKLFNQIFNRWINRQGFIFSFRRTSFEGMKGARKSIEAGNAYFVKDMMEGSDYDKILVDKKGFFKVIPPEKLIGELTELTVSQAQIAVDAASIVFAHSVLDGAAFDYCRVTALVAPRDWESVIDQRQIRLSDVRGSDYEQILREKLGEFFEQLERESLLKKADHLFARCKPPANWSPMHGYVYDRDRLIKLDDYRQQVIHGNGPVQGIADADEEVDYLMRMVLFFQGLVNLRYGLTLNPVYAFTGKELPPMPAVQPTVTGPESAVKVAAAPDLNVTRRNKE